MGFLEVLDRRNKGTPVSRKDWDIKYVAKGIRKILKEYDLDYKKGDIIVLDGALASRFYDAGRELAVRNGIFDQDTERLINFSYAEIDEVAGKQNKNVTVGQGSDSFDFYPRCPEDNRVPGVVAGTPGTPMDEATFCHTVESWAKEPCVNMVTCGSIVDVDGYMVRGGEPTELIAVRRELRYLNEICTKVGKPFIGRLAAESSVSMIGDLSAMGKDGIRAGDAHLICFNNELITNTDNLIRAASNIRTGIRNATLACVMVGGLAGGAAGAAVAMISSMLCSNVLYHADYHLCHPIHMQRTATSMPECMWLQSAVNQAFAKRAPCVIVNDIYPKSGAGTKELLREVAANALAITVSGGHLEGVGSCDGLKPHCSGLEVRMMGAVGRAAAEQKITREQADTMIRSLLSGYDYVLNKSNEGLPFEEVYDLETMSPKAFWQNIYDDVAEELDKLGLSI